MLFDGAGERWLLLALPQAFYKADIDKDMLRVNRLFQSAASLNIRIQKRYASVPRSLPIVT